MMHLKIISRLLFFTLIALAISIPVAQAEFIPPNPILDDLMWGWDPAFGEAGIATYRPGYGTSHDVVSQQTFILPDGKILAGIES